MLPLSERLATTVNDDRAYRPRLFRVGNTDDREALDRLLAERPQVVVSDTIRRQLAELIRIRHPQRRLQSFELESLIDAGIGTRSAFEYGVWAYYPWSDRLVHLLDEDEFAEVRTNRNTYKIAPDERVSLAGKRIGVVGLSVGQSVALVLALERSFGELRLADFDTLDLSNLNRLRAGVHEIGIAKVLVTARQIAEIDPYLNVVGFFDGVNESNVEAFLAEPLPLDLLIEECDSLDLKIIIRHAARRRRIPVLMDTSDRGLLDVERFDLEPDRPIFHGLVGDLDPTRLRGLTTDEKIPYVLRIIGERTISTRMRASLLEIEQTISTWPQLASSVAMGGAVAADVARRILLGQHSSSGRFFVDVDDAVPDAAHTERELHRPPWPSPPRPPSCRVLAAPPDATNLSDDAVRRLVAAATSAPSGGNSQPWRWIWSERCLHVLLDTRHSRSLLDFQSLASVAAIGAAAETLVLAAHQDGLGVRVSVFPDPAQPVLAATFNFCERGAAGDEAADADTLASAIHQRVTNRQGATRSRLGDDALLALEASLSRIAGARLHWLGDDDGLDEVGRLLGAGDRLLFLDRRLHQELLTEIAFEDSTSARGIPIATLELSPPDRAGLEVARSWPALELVKSWGGGANLEKMSRKAVAAASAFAVLTMPSSSRASYFAGGRAFQRLWLTATMLHVGLQPMTALSYLFARLHHGGGEELEPQTLHGLLALWPRWSRLFGLSGGEAEVLAFRLIAAGPPAARSPRCAVDDVLEIIPPV